MRVTFRKCSLTDGQYCVYLVARDNADLRLSSLSEKLRTEETARTTLAAQLDGESASRRLAEIQLLEARTGHSLVVDAIANECKEPFVVPALLEAFLSLAELCDQAA